MSNRDDDDNNSDWKTDDERGSPYQTDVLGTDLAEDIRNVAKDLNRQKADRAAQEEAINREMLEQSRICGPFYVAVKHVGLNSWRAETMKVLPFRIPTVVATGNTEEQAMRRMHREYAFALIRAGICRDLEEGAEVAINTKFIPQSVPHIWMTDPN